MVLDRNILFLKVVIERDPFFGNWLFGEITTIIWWKHISWTVAIDRNSILFNGYLAGQHFWGNIY